MHPSLSLLVSASDDMSCKLWDWDKVSFFRLHCTRGVCVDLLEMQDEMRVPDITVKRLPNAHCLPDDAVIGLC